MNYHDAIAALDAQWAAGDMDADEYELERAAIEYAHQQAQSEADTRQGVAA